jgi:LmbE family N-acetylglucosaminyl deacetylase
MRQLGWFGPEPVRSVLAIGAHSDDIEIGCGGTILSLARSWPEARVHWLVLAAHGDRIDEARTSAEAFLASLREPIVEIQSRRDGYLPYEASEVKDTFEALKARIDPDLVLTHTRDDLHQDHRLVCDLTWNTFRDHLVLEYEIPKYDGDFGSPNVFMGLSRPTAERKVELLLEHFETQRDRRWFTSDLFFAVMRIRGMESNSPSRLAEGFYGRKVVLAAPVQDEGASAGHALAAASPPAPSLDTV